MVAAVSEMHRFPGGMVRFLTNCLIAASSAALVVVSQSALGTTNQLTTELTSPKKLRVTALLQAITTLHKTEQDGRSSSGRIVLAPSYQLSPDYRATLTGSLIQNLDQEQKTQFSNTKISVSRQPLQLTQDTAVILSAGGRLPTNEDDRRDNTFNGSLQFEPQAFTEWSARGFRFTTIYALSAVKNFHTYDRNNLARANMSYSVTPYVGFETYILKNVVLTLDGDMTLARTYQDSPRTLFSFGQSLTFEQKGWSATIGHTNAADAFTYNGTDSNVRLFDDNTSAVYGQLRVAY